MSSYATALRQARSEIIPQVPELAPYLPSEPNIIRSALLDVVARQDVDPATIPEKDINKATRHTMAGFLIKELCETVVEGEGRDAHFIPQVDGHTRGSIYKRRGHFMGGVNDIQDYGATRVERRYTGGRDVAHSWLPGLSRRYYELGLEAREITPHRRKPWWADGNYITSPIPLDGRYTARAMRSEGLASGVDYYARIIRAKVEAQDQRLQAAHDMAHIATGMASGHFYEIIAKHPSPKRVAAHVAVDNRRNVFNMRLPASERHKIYPTVENLPNVVLKCPAHAALTPEQAAEQGNRDTSLVYFIHAAINLAHEQYDLFR